jgi:hypothetical protein
LIQSTIHDLFQSTTTTSSSGIARTAAIIYMFVEPAFRGRHLGVLALQVIAFLHASVADCDYTLLVADDKSSVSSSVSSSSSSSSSGEPEQPPPLPQHRLVDWYEREGGFVRAPALQELMGSPNQIHGISMIGPTTTFTAAAATAAAERTRRRRKRKKHVLLLCHFHKIARLNGITTPTCCCRLDLSTHLQVEILHLMV